MSERECVCLSGSAYGWLIITRTRIRNIAIVTEYSSLSSRSLIGPCALHPMQMDLALRSVRPWVRWAKEKRLQFRIEETNTLSIQGLAGASDTLAAALFYVDYALTLIQAGVHGMNFHDSWCSAYSAIVFPSVR